MGGEQPENRLFAAKSPGQAIVRRVAAKGHKKVHVEGKIGEAEGPLVWVADDMFGRGRLRKGPG